MKRMAVLTDKEHSYYQQSGQLHYCGLLAGESQGGWSPSQWFSARDHELTISNYDVHFYCSPLLMRIRKYMERLVYIEMF